MVAIPLVLLVAAVVVVDSGCRVAGCIRIFGLGCEASTVIVLHIKMPTAAAKSNFILMPDQIRTPEKEKVVSRMLEGDGAPFAPS